MSLLIRFIVFLVIAISGTIALIVVLRKINDEKNPQDKLFRDRSIMEIIEGRKEKQNGK